jgi:hypothetical protein
MVANAASSFLRFTEESGPAGYGDALDEGVGA